MKTKSHLFTRSLLMAVLLSVANFTMAASVGVYCYMNGPEVNANGDSNIRTCIRMNAQGEALLEVENMTDHVIYVDRRNSFSVVNGRSVQLFIPSANTESHTVGRGVIYGEDTDVKWVDGESHTSSTTVYDQPIQAIAPHGTSVVYVWSQLPQLLRSDMIDIGHSGRLFSYHSKGRFADSQSRFKKGESRRYAEDYTPLTISAIVSYALDDSHGALLRVSCSDYVSRISIDSGTGIKKDGLLRSPYAGRCFAFLSGKRTRVVIGECAVVAAIVAVIVKWNADAKHFSETSRSMFP